MIEGTGPVIEGTGPVIEGTGPVIEGMGPVIEGMGPEIEGTGPEIEGTGPPNSGGSPKIKESKRSLSQPSVAGPPRYTFFLQLAFSLIFFFFSPCSPAFIHPF